VHADELPGAEFESVEPDMKDVSFRVMARRRAETAEPAA
jgi:hypothetical protein